MRRQDRIIEELLVLDAQSGDRAALERLVALRHPRLIAHAMRLLRDRETARDVVQEAWIDILRGLKGLQDARAFPAWALRIVSRKAARVVATAVRDRAIATEIGAPDPVEPDGPAAADADAVRRAIAALPPAQAATVALFYLEDMRVAEVAIALDVPPGTVKTRLMHARAALAAALKGESDDGET